MTALYLYKLKLQDQAEWLSLCNPVIDDEPQQADWLTKINGIVTIGTITKPAQFDTKKKHYI